MGNALRFEQSTTDGAVLVDHAVVEGLRAVFGDATAALLSKTRAIILDRLAQMATAERSGEWERLGRLAHEVGGMAAQVGLARLSDAALALEAACQNDADAAALSRDMAAMDAIARTSLERLSAD